MSDVRQSVGFLAVLLFVGSSLHGCGGGGGGDATTTHPAAATTSTQTTTTITKTSSTTITTSTVTWEVDSPCVAEGDLNKCVDYLNDQYLGYDPESSTSPLGVTIRGQPRFNKKWFFCGGGCFNGQPDCYTAASILNHKEMLREGTYAIMPMEYPVGIVFQPKAIQEQLTKCSWEFDGSAFQNVNGGCGVAPPGEHDCKSNMSAYYNLCPDTGKPISDDYSCPTVTRADCTVNLADYPGTCYWKGAAFYSDATPTTNLHPPNLTRGTDHGLRQMMKQRMTNQGNGSRMNLDNVSLLQYWNEVTIDGKVLEAMLAWTPRAAVAAFMYDKDIADAKGWADQYNEQFQKDYGIKVPIVAFDSKKKIGAGSGPFVAPTTFEELSV